MFVDFNATLKCNFLRQIRDTNKQVNELIEKRMMSGDPMDDKLSLFRQQVSHSHHSCPFSLSLLLLCSNCVVVHALKEQLMNNRHFSCAGRNHCAQKGGVGRPAARGER